MKKNKRILAALLSFVLAMSLSVSAFAAEPAVVAKSTAVDSESVGSSSEVTLPASVSPRSIYGYAADYTDTPHDDFTVNATGSYTLTGGATIKSSDFASSTQITYVSIYRPDGSLAVSNVKLTGNQEKVVNFTNAQPGNYRVAYDVNGVNKGWIHCWIY